MAGGYLNEQQWAAFTAANARVRRGGPEARVCGARTRTGAACQNVPIREGKGRCLNHAGPHAARLHRARQMRDFMSGKISAEEWNRAEARRAANRLGWAWKKNPWTPGRTIDLGTAEGDLRADLSARGLDVDALPPAVADWLRWRYRRTQIDRLDARALLRVLTETLPGRIAKAGPRPAGSGAPTVALAARTWTPDGTGADATSKRRQPDQPRAPKVIRGKGYGRRGRPRTQAPKGDEMDDLMAIYRAHRTTLAPMLDRCRSEGERLAVLRALRDFQTDPNARSSREQWFAFLRSLRAI
ncbi:MAG: hypothetical protein K0B00_14025 [Rhodobacteraceae bacterium]|nr:hypothetical protein [Paracoccaceae bacterium]